MWLVHMVLVFLLIGTIDMCCVHVLKQSYTMAYAVIAYTYGTLHIREVLRKTLKELFTS